MIELLEEPFFNLRYKSEGKEIIKGPFQKKSEWAEFTRYMIPRAPQFWFVTISTPGIGEKIILVSSRVFLHFPTNTFEDLIPGTV